MADLKDIQDNVAKSFGYHTYNEALLLNTRKTATVIAADVAKEYAKEAVVDELESLIMLHEDDFDRGKAKHNKTTNR